MNALISILGKRALKNLDTDKIKPNSDVSLGFDITSPFRMLLIYNFTESVRRTSPGIQKWPNRQVQDPGATDSRRTVIQRPGNPEKGAKESIQMGPRLQVLLLSRAVRLVLLHWLDSCVSDLWHLPTSSAQCN